MPNNFTNMRRRLRLAISARMLAETDRLDERENAVEEILHIDSLELVGLVMALEENGTIVKTVGDLMRFLDGTKD